MTISLEKKLEEATVAKKRYRALFLGVFVVLAVLLGMIYHTTVLDYAVIDKVTLTRTGEAHPVSFQFDVIEPGSIDVHYGQAMLTDRKTVQPGDGVRGPWKASGPTEVSIRSRPGFFTRGDRETFTF
jgi:hypothetical protein